MRWKTSARPMASFDPCLREGGDGGIPCQPHSLAGFDPRLREGGDLDVFDLVAQERLFRSTPPRRRRLDPMPRSASRELFRSTPPRRRRLVSTQSSASATRVSIHASAKEATPERVVPQHLTDVSIHASAKEATAIGRACGDGDGVSIHASAKEATQQRERERRRRGFDPRLREGGDKISHLTRSRTRCFDPRLREGGDTTSARKASSPARFRSTPPRRRRHDLRKEGVKSGKVSIHASAKEATLPCRRPGLRDSGFDPRLREGGDPRRLATAFRNRGFDPRLREGGDRASRTGA